MKILIIEDSARLRRALSEGLRRSGFTLDLAADGKEGLAYAHVNEYDVIVLDLMLPKLDGLSVLKQLRDEGNRSQVLILSAKDEIQDRVRGLELGADDYLVKPFAFEELVARIKTLVRRTHDHKNPKLKISQVEIDLARREVATDQQTVSLTPSEYNLIEYLALRKGRVVSKAQLEQWLYNSDSETSSNVVEVLVSNIRKKLRSIGTQDIIKTKRGFGYFVE